MKELFTQESAKKSPSLCTSPLSQPEKSGFWRRNWDKVTGYTGALVAATGLYMMSHELLDSHNVEVSSPGAITTALGFTALAIGVFGKRPNKTYEDVRGLDLGLSLADRTVYAEPVARDEQPAIDAEARFADLVAVLSEETMVTETIGDMRISGFNDDTTVISTVGSAEQPAALPDRGRMAMGFSGVMVPVIDGSRNSSV